MARRRSQVRLHSPGIREVLTSPEMHRVIAETAQAVADHIWAENVQMSDGELPVEVETYETDRARASVILAHPGGLAVQAKHGLLTRAASAEGLEIGGGPKDTDLIEYTTKAGVTRLATRAQVANWTRGRG